MAEWMLSKPVNLILVFIAGVIFLVAIIGYRDQLGGMLAGFCDKWPMFCGGTPDEEAEARASMDALICAIDSVNSGQDKSDECPIEGVTGSSGPGGRGNVLIPSAGSLVLKPRIDENPVAEGLTGFATVMSFADENPFSGDFVECTSGDLLKDYGGAFMVYVEEGPGSEEAAKGICVKTCPTEGIFTGCDALLEEKDTVEYHEVRPQGQFLRCECRNDELISNTNIAILVPGVNMMDIMENCKSMMKDYAVSYDGEPEEIAYPDNAEKSYIVPGSCRKIEAESDRISTSLKKQTADTFRLTPITMDSTSYMVKRKTSLGSESIDALKTCTCEIEIDGGTIQYPVYGFSESEAKEDCRDDQEYLAASSVGMDIGDYSVSDCENYEGDARIYEFREKNKFLFITTKRYDYSYAKHSLREYECTQEKTAETLACTVNGFSLPESFEGINTPKAWIEGFGDPQFLIYYDRFPEGEAASWNGMNAWVKGMSTVLFGTLCLTSIATSFAGPAFKVLKAGARATIMKNVLKGMKGVSKVDDIADNAKIVRRVAKTVDKVDDFKVVNKVDDLAKYKFGEGIYETAKELKSLPGETVLKQSKGVAETIKKATGYAVAEGVFVSPSAYAAALIDSVVGKFVSNPGSMVLKNPLNPPLKVTNVGIEEVPANEHNPVTLAKPLILHKTETKSLGSNPDKPFYLASPCKADLNVTMEFVKCGMYSYDKELGSVYCDNPVMLKTQKDIAKYPECGLDRKLLNIYGEKVFNSMMAMYNWEGNIFEYPENPDRFMTPSRIYLPILSNQETGRIYITLKDTTQEIIDKQDRYIPQEWYDSGNFSVYSVDMYVEGEGKVCDNINYITCAVQCGSEKMLYSDSETMEHLNSIGYKEPIDPKDCGGGEAIWHCSDASVFSLRDMMKEQGGECAELAEKLPHDDLYMHFYGHIQGYGKDNRKFFYQSLGFEENFWKSNKIIINDYNLDGKMDMFRIISSGGLFGGEDELIEVWTEPGKNAIVGFNCKVPAIVVTPDQSNYPKDKKNNVYNYCYKRDRNWLVWTTTIGEIMFDSLAMAFPGVGHIFAIAANCGLAYLETTQIQINWPNS